MRVLVPGQPESANRASVRNLFRAFVRPGLGTDQPVSALLLAAVVFFAGPFVFGFTLNAQSPTGPAAAPAQAPANPPVHHHKKPSAAKPTTQATPAPAPVVQAAPVPVPCPDGPAASALPTTVPCIPNWPANNKPAEATVVWDSHGLFIAASNSSLDRILNEISLKTGARVEGMGADERIFGTYGPGPARDVLTELLDGSGYNILLVGDLGQGTPRRIVLSGRPTGPAPPPGPPTDNEAEQEAPEAPPTGAAPVVIPGAMPPPPVPVRTPQSMMQQQQMQQQEQQLMQQRRLQLDQEQQQQQQENNQQNQQ